MQLTLEQIPALAAKFQTLVFDPNAECNVEFFGGAFVWSDEKPDFDSLNTTIPVARFFQYLLWYRKSLIQEEPAGAFTEFWDAFKEVCPSWPGFRPERCDPSLRDELNADVYAMMKKLERAIKVCDRKKSFERSENAG